MKKRSHLRRLDRIWLSHPIYFITVCTQNRQAFLDNSHAVHILREEWGRAKERHGWLIGRYVVMPDHIHFFCAEQSVGSRSRLAHFVGRWKEWTAKNLVVQMGLATPVWQPEFFDHLLRSNESYSEKWSYVRENPVRAGLVESWEKWPWQGAVDFDFPK